MPSAAFQRMSQSWWYGEQEQRPRFPRLSREHHTDVLVIGAGITGMSVALELAERGKRVTVCDSNMVGAGTTSNSTGHLDAHPEQGAERLVKLIGEPAARTYTALRRAAIERIAERADESCELVRVAGYHYSESEADRDRLKRDYLGGLQLGLAAEWVDEVPISWARFGYRLDGMARINIGRYLLRLVELARAAGVTIFEDTLVETPRHKSANELAAGDGRVHYEHVVCATHCNFSDSLRLYAATPPYQSYTLIAEVSDPPADALFWDNSEPYYYVRRTGDAHPDHIIVGGCDHRTGVEDGIDAQARLEAWVQQRFEVRRIVHRGSAELFEPADGLPLIGAIPGYSNAFVATGFSGIGLTLGTLAGAALADEVEGRSWPLAEEFSPSRAKLRTIINAPKQWLSEQLTAGANFAERITPAEEVDVSKLEPGVGAVGKVDGRTVGACRDSTGCVHQVEAVCPHMGGALHWNAAEQTWDCPVHGGRFTADGQRLYGPPTEDLKTFSNCMQRPA